MVRRTLGLLAVTALLAGACVGDSQSTSRTDSPDATVAEDPLPTLQAKVNELEAEVARLGSELAAASGELVRALQRETWFADQLEQREDDLKVLVERRDELLAEIDTLNYLFRPAEYGWENAPSKSCEARVFQELESDDDDVTVGPLRLDGLNGYATVEEGTPFDVTAVITDRREVLLVVPDEFKDVLELRYGDEVTGVVGGRAIILQGCGRGTTMYAGGFDVVGPTCAAVDVYVDESTNSTRVWIPYAVSACP